MKIGIVGGTGKEGRGIALRWAKAGHQVAIGSRDAERAAAKASELSTPGTLLTGTDNATVCREAEVVLLSIPFSGHRETLEALKEALENLSYRERRVLELRYGLGGEHRAEIA